MASGQTLCVCRMTQRNAVLEYGPFLSFKELLWTPRIIGVEECCPHKWYDSIASVTMSQSFIELC